MAKEKVVYPDIPTSISSINVAYIKAYLSNEYRNGNLSAAKVKEVNKARKEAQKNSPSRYFFPYRKEFCRICLPNLYKPTSSAPNWDDFFKNLLGDEA